MRSSIFPATLALAFVAGCANKANTGAPGAPGVDAATAAPPGLNLTNRFASALSLASADASLDGGTPLPPVYAVFTAYESPDLSIATRWELCDLPLPGLLTIPTEVLNNYRTSGPTASTDGKSDGAAFTQPEVAYVVGVQLADPTHDPLPSDPSRVCADSTSTGCAIPDPITGKPGVAIKSGADDVDLVYLVARLTFAVAARADADGSMAGMVTSTTLESHVLACRLRATGADCAPSDVARLEAMHPSTVALDGGTFRAHTQVAYFTCPQLQTDPAAALAGLDPNNNDAGVGAGGDGGLGSMSFSLQVQTDLDAMGCATGGCHETFTHAGEMHLTFRPDTAALIEANYRAVLPYAQADDRSKLLTQVPLPPAMQARWLSWIRDGRPY
jgi:hypothetical protein